MVVVTLLIEEVSEEEDQAHTLHVVEVSSSGSVARLDRIADEHVRYVVDTVI